MLMSSRLALVVFKCLWCQRMTNLVKRFRFNFSIRTRLVYLEYCPARFETCVLSISRWSRTAIAYACALIFSVILCNYTFYVVFCMCMSLCIGYIGLLRFYVLPTDHQRLHLLFRGSGIKSVGPLSTCVEHTHSMLHENDSHYIAKLFTRIHSCDLCIDNACACY